MNGEILSINKVFNDVLCRYEYQIVINLLDEPGFRLGDCEVKQK